MIRAIYRAIIFFISVPQFGLALIVNEIAYDPDGTDSGREWIEVYNDSETGLAISGYKLFEANVSHGLTAIQGGNMVPPLGYAVIADNSTKFLLDFPTYTGVLFDSSFSLSNSGELLVLRDLSGATVDSLTYSPSFGGQDDGTTLSFLGNEWTAGSPTPGQVNQKAITSPPQATSSPNSITPITAPQGSSVSLTIDSKKVIIAGAASEFSVSASKDGKLVDGFDYVWSFGDGGSGRGKRLSYHYLFPGNYVVYVEGVSSGEVVTSRVKVIVLPPSLSIVNVVATSGTHRIDVENRSMYELDVSGWYVDINGLRYSFPKNTFLNQRSSTSLSGLSLGVPTSTVVSYAALVFPNLEIAPYSRYQPGSSSSTATLRSKKVDQSIFETPKKMQVQVQTARVQVATTTVIKKDVSTTTIVRSSEAAKDTTVASWLKKLIGF